MEKLKQLGSALKGWATTIAQKLVETLKQGIQRTLLEVRLQLLTGLIKSFGQVEEEVNENLQKVRSKLLDSVKRTERKLKDDD